MFNKSVYEEAFECDGSHRDLYVLSTSLTDWHGFLRLITSPRYRFSFQLDGSPALMPSDGTLLFMAEARPLLQIHLVDVTLNCHFFRVEEIELDLDPKELTDDAAADAILLFMAELGAALGKPVLITAENARDAVIFRYDPATEQTTYKPAV